MIQTGDSVDGRANSTGRRALDDDDQLASQVTCVDLSIPERENGTSNMVEVIRPGAYDRADDLKVTVRCVVWTKAA